MPLVEVREREKKEGGEGEKEKKREREISKQICRKETRPRVPSTALILSRPCSIFPFFPASASSSLFILRRREFTSPGSPLRFQCALKHAEITSELMDSLSNLSISARTRASYALRTVSTRSSFARGGSLILYVPSDAKFSHS